MGVVGRAKETARAAVRMVGTAKVKVVSVVCLKRSCYSTRIRPAVEPAILPAARRANCVSCLSLQDLSGSAAGWDVAATATVAGVLPSSQFPHWTRAPAAEELPERADFDDFGRPHSSARIRAKHHQSVVKSLLHKLTCGPGSPGHNWWGRQGLLVIRAVYARWRVKCASCAESQASCALLRKAAYRGSCSIDSRLAVPPATAEDSCGGVGPGNGGWGAEVHT